MSFLLEETDSVGAWHQAPMRWGKGMISLVGKAGEAARWDQPTSVRFSTRGVDLVYALFPDVELRVARRFGKVWSERYCLINRRDRRIVLGVFGISTPWRDVYLSAKDSLRAACHAHVWTGGAHSWAWAWPMRGVGPGVGLRLTQGELWSYSVESRNPWTSSNIRGHILLHATDHARAPHAFGGQPAIVIPPGGAYELAWELGWHASPEAFAAAVPPPLRPAAFSVEVGKPLELRLAPGAKVAVPTGARLAAGNFIARRPGEFSIEIRHAGKRSRITLAAHPPLRKVVETRLEGILRWHQARCRGGARAGSFLPVDTGTGLQINEGNWYDWSDGRERMAMPILCAQALRLGWGDGKRLRAAVDGFAAYARAHLMGPGAEVLEDSFHPDARRMYNYPWLAEFFLRTYGLTGNARDLDDAARIMEAYYRRGGGKFMGFVEVVVSLIPALVAAKQVRRAEALRKEVLAHARHFLALGTNLPGHEVNYEQSVTAPFLLLIDAARRLTADAPSRRGQKPAAWQAAWDRIFPWLDAFAAWQPHARLHQVPIRHWDGYWFGLNRQWGDTFPHYWTVLSAAAFTGRARELRRQGREAEAVPLERKAKTIFDANLLSFWPDGHATCAFVMPSCVNGAPAHQADPLANDQDWALVWYLDYPELWLS